MFERDVKNLAVYFGQFAPELLTTSYAQEIWHLYKNGHLTPDIKLTGHFKGSHKEADLESIIREIDDARDEALRRKEARDLQA
jgi:RIO kinase 1